MEYKTTTRLFRGKYQYKIVLVCSGASYFRNDLDSALDTLKKITLTAKSHHIKTQEDLDYAFKLHNALSKMKDIDVRVESPWISIYTNNKKDTEVLAKISEDNVKYISVPAGNLEEGTVLMPKMDFEFRVTLGKTTQEHSAFIEWAETNPKVKLTKSCIKDLLRPRTWGGKHFYITGNNNLLLAKMHLGGSIAKVERIVKK